MTLTKHYLIHAQVGLFLVKGVDAIDAYVSFCVNPNQSPIDKLEGEFEPTVLDNVYQVKQRRNK